jgi:phosphoglycerate dehydrogenase-like enzyme
MKILFLFQLDEYWQKKFNDLQSEFPQHEFTNITGQEKRTDAFKTTDAVVCGRLSEDELRNSTVLKAIFVPFTGLNNFPLELIREKNLILSNTHANAKYVAEHAVMLAMALLGNAVDYHNRIKEGYWSREKDGDNMWETLQDKTIGILGLGHIGQNIARLLKSFNCRIIGFKKHTKGFRNDNIDEVTSDLLFTVMKSDVIFTALPLTKETKGLINADILAEMKGKYIINVGRGETISEDALYNALKGGILKGAALDVWYKYPSNEPEPVYPANLPFWDLPNVLLSPHKSSQTEAARIKMVDDTAENIRTYLKNGTPKQIAAI